MNSQDRQFLSTEFNTSYDYYFFRGDYYSNKLNYGFSLLGSMYVNRLKVSSGITYSIFSFDTKEDKFNSIKKSKHKVVFLNVPIILSIEILSKKKYSINVLAGIMFFGIKSYDVKYFYLNGNIVAYEGQLYSRGPAVMTGIVYSKLIGQRCRLNLSPLIKYKEIGNLKRRGIHNIPTLSIRLKVGIEYLFNDVGDN